MSVNNDKSATSSASPSPTTPNATSNGEAQAAQGTPSATASASNPAGFVLPPGMPPIAGMQFVPYFPPMTAVAAQGGEAGEGNAQAQAAQGAMMIHPAFLQQMYSYPYGMMSAGMKLKRKQVKNACTNCQKACKKCDDERPCTRCVKYDIANECSDSVRKERRKGIKRGSYKKKPLPGEEDENTTANNAAANVAAAAQFLPAAAYSAQLYSQWAAAALGAASGAKSGEATAGYYPYFIAAPMPQGDASTSGDGAAVAGAAPMLASPMFHPGFPVPAGSAEQPAASSSTKPTNVAKGKQSDKGDAMDAEEEDEVEEDEADDYDEHEASSKRKRSKRKRKGN